MKDAHVSAGLWRRCLKSLRKRRKREESGWKPCFDVAFTVSGIPSAPSERSQRVLGTGGRLTASAWAGDGRPSPLRWRRLDPCGGSQGYTEEPAEEPSQLEVPGSLRDVFVHRLCSPKVRGRGARTPKVTCFASLMFSGRSLNTLPPPCL